MHSLAGLVLQKNHEALNEISGGVQKICFVYYTFLIEYSQLFQARRFINSARIQGLMPIDKVSERRR